MSIIRQVTIRGRVQGVGYRAWVEHEAISRDLEGWVRNRRDVAAWRRGPSMARVDYVQQEDANSDALNLRQAGELFSVLPTI